MSGVQSVAIAGETVTVERFIVPWQWLTNLGYRQPTEAHAIAYTWHQWSRPIRLACLPFISVCMPADSVYIAQWSITVLTWPEVTKCGHSSVGYAIFIGATGSATGSGIAYYSLAAHKCVTRFDLQLKHCRHLKPQLIEGWVDLTNVCHFVA